MMTSATLSSATEEADRKGEIGSDTIFPTSTLEPLQSMNQTEYMASHLCCKEYAHTCNIQRTSSSWQVFLLWCTFSIEVLEKETI
jgi:hypothetical protein